MNTYLQTYLNTMPGKEQETIIKYVSSIIVDNLGINENNAIVIVQNILNGKLRSNRDIVLYDNDKPIDSYNEYYKDIYIDLVYLYKNIQVLNEAIESIWHLILSYLEASINDITKLSETIDHLSRAPISTDIEISMNDFNKNKGVMSSSVPNAFLDRDGKTLEACQINAENNLILSSIAENINHSLYAKTHIVDYRMPPLVIGDPKYCTDNNVFTYLDCSIYSKEPLESINHYGDGAYIVLSITLPNISKIDEIVVEPIGSISQALANILIDNIDIGLKPIVLSKPVSIPLINQIGGEIKIVLKQDTYEKTNTITDSIVDDLWNDKDTDLIRRYENDIEEYVK